MSQSVSRMLPSSGFALGKPMIVPCCCVKKTNHSGFSVLCTHTSFFPSDLQSEKKEKDSTNSYPYLDIKSKLQSFRNKVPKTEA